MTMKTTVEWRLHGCTGSPPKGYNNNILHPVAACSYACTFHKNTSTHTEAQTRYDINSYSPGDQS